MPAIELVESIDIPILSAPHLRSAVGRYCCKSRKANDTKISRKLILIGVSTAATLSSAGTKVRGRFSLKRCGPSRRRVRNASAVQKNSFASQKRLFQHYPPQAGYSITLHSANVRFAPGVGVRRLFVEKGHHNEIASSRYRQNALASCTAIGTKSDRTPRQQIPRRFVAVDMPNRW